MSVVAEADNNRARSLLRRDNTAASKKTTVGLLSLPFSSPSEGSCVRVAPGPLDCWVRRQEKGEAFSKAGKKRRRSSSSGLDTHSVSYGNLRHSDQVPPFGE
ncbi:hypothetical protein MTO96_049197 [Rhipicephalus appendiculatus]